jgi:hypothetical protein
MGHGHGFLRSDQKLCSTNDSDRRLLYSVGSLVATWVSITSKLTCFAIQMLPALRQGRSPFLPITTLLALLRPLNQT